ncbi:MAG: hypothetical protein ABI866_13735, partial [Dokdonella sp.]
TSAAMPAFTKNPCYHAAGHFILRPVVHKFQLRAIRPLFTRREQVVAPAALVAAHGSHHVVRHNRIQEHS